MHSIKTLVPVLIVLTLAACGGKNGDGHSGGEASSPLSTQEFGDVVARMVQQKDDSADPQTTNDINWTFHVNENETAFDSLF